MPNITYLLGAGASANALPLIKKGSTNTPGLPQELVSFIEQYKASDVSESKILDHLIPIGDKCIEFGTPDLYAKFLLESGDMLKYRLLKRLLSNYFEYKQTIAYTGNQVNNQGFFDMRALVFLTTITQNKKIPDCINLLSWNYDRQIEIAAQRLKPLNPGGYKTLQNFSCWPNVTEGSSADNIPFLLHLNGVAGHDYSKRTLNEESKKIFDFTFGEPLLSFAWEDELNDDKKTFIEKRMQIAKLIASKTEILVIIGYSFPFFNRKIDGDIFKAMKQSLQKIYIQDPFNNGSQLKGQFDLSITAATNIIHISQVDNYHIPFEL